MPFSIPDDIKNHIKSQMPATHKMWWMRGIILNIEEKKIARADMFPALYYRFHIGDVDADPDDVAGYAIDILSGEIRNNSTGQSNNLVTDFRLNDRISLFGHEPKDAQRLSFARFFHHHELNYLGPCFETRYLDGNGVPVPMLKIENTNASVDVATKFFGYLVGASKENLTPGYNMRPLYEQVSNEMHRRVKAYDDPNYPCQNPRYTKPKQGGRLVD